MIPVGIAALLLQMSSGQAAAAAPSDSVPLRHATGRVAPTAIAVRISGPAPHIDGRLDDAAWANAPPITGFTQNVPIDGQPASESTEVRFVYDDQALYVAARMYDREPALVRGQLSRRDGYTQADAFTVALDSYHDHRTSFYFSVNASGVKSDQITSDDYPWGDQSWDPVWDVATRRDSLGWTAELKIPFSQLRFPPGAQQVWGVNVVRWIERKAERSVWSWAPQTDRGFASFFGHLLGMGEVPQPRRLEVLPYVTAREERINPGASGNPFNDGSEERASAGLDLKYGVTSNLTLAATFNPDFGQVEADPAVVNLSAFETFFEERRPFFVEGSDIFNFGGNQFFYSRRVGRAPQGSANARGGFVDQPRSATILGAAKLSGRTRGGWALGFLEALTAREFASVDSAGVRFHDEVEPLTNYAVARGRRDFGGGANSIGFIATAVNRDVDTAGLRFLRTAAYAGGVDFTHRFSHNRYNLSGSFGFSDIRGDTLAIQRAQLSSARYYQRPDQHYVRYVPGRTRLDGWTASLSLGKEAGKYQFGLYGTAISPGFELNDAGFQTSADGIEFYGFVNSRWTRPGRVFRYAFAGNNLDVVSNFGGVRTRLAYNLNLYGQFLSYWAVDAHLTLTFRTANDGLTRGGPLGVTPFQWNVNGGVNTDPRKHWSVYVSGSHTRDELGGGRDRVSAYLDWRPTRTLAISFGPSLSTSLTMQQYLRSQSDSTATATYARQYVFGEISQHTLDLTTRLNVTFSPTLSLQLYTQPFVATGDYDRFKELAAPRTTDYIIYGVTPGSTLVPHCFDASGTEVSCSAPGAPAPSSYDADPDGSGPRASVRINNPNFGVRSLRGNAVLRWEYRPGSTLFLVWTTACAASSGDPRFDPLDQTLRLCQGRSDNVFAVKVNYWINM